MIILFAFREAVNCPWVTFGFTGASAPVSELYALVELYLSLIHI